MLPGGAKCQELLLRYREEEGGLPLSGKCLLSLVLNRMGSLETSKLL